MRTRILAVVLITTLACCAALAQAGLERGMAGQIARPTPAAVQAPALPQSTTQAQQPAAPAEQAKPMEMQGVAPLRVTVGKSVLISTADRIRRVSVTDPSIADAVGVMPTQILIHGRAPGEVSLIIWDEQERSRSFDLRVDIDVTAAEEEIRRIFPGRKIDVTASRAAIVLSGHVDTKEDAERVGSVAGAYTKNVVNVLTYGPTGAQQILLEVKFAEVDRTAVTQLGVNLFSTGAANTFGATQTGQFAPFTGSNSGAVTSDVKPGSNPNGNHLATGEINGGLFHQPGSFGMSDLMNIFLFRNDLNLGAVIRALQQKNVLQILAEPNLIAVNGKESSFLAGGEFPIPVVQGAGTASSVTIQFKEFGVKLRFTPVITADNNIHLRVAPEVSALDFANGVTLGGFTVPGLTTRRAETEFEIQDGQSFVIAGLMDNRLTSLISKVPGLGDIPILGTLFKSKNLQKSKTELMVLVTARRVSPAAQPPVLPAFPHQFLDQKAKDSKPTAGETN